MEKLKRKEAFDRAVAAFGPWKSWTRSNHLAYGLIRGVEYARMERCSNDAPPIYDAARSAARLGAWPDFEPKPNSWGIFSVPDAYYAEICSAVRWVRKTPRRKPEAFDEARG